jgi:putative transposase
MAKNVVFWYAPAHMARAPRIDVGNQIYHVVNRANGRAKMFHTDRDYQEFEALLSEIKETFDMRILGYAIMPNHWHLLLYPRKDKDLSKALHWLTTTHVRRHHTRNKTIGHGHLYQGPYKSSLIANEKHLLTVLKYIERNPVRAKLCRKAEGWKWGSASRRGKHLLLAGLPVELPRAYAQWVNEPEPAEALKAIRQSINKGVPYQGTVE